MTNSSKITTDTKKHTPEYISIVDKFNKAEEAFDKNPCKSTAKVLSDIRFQMSNLKENQIYNQEYLKETRLRERNRMSNYVATLGIAIKLERGILSQSQAGEAFKAIDIIHPIN